MSVTLPGIKFTAETKVVDDFLPRMDIAAFVGFASTGPINIPVSIEDEQQFQSIFGPDLPILWDSGKGQIQYAYLGPAVRGFFQAGGQRCWVVRVADDNAKNQWFPVPGMAGIELSQLQNISSSGSVKSPTPAFILARSPGSWADTLTVRTVLQRESFGMSTFSSTSKNSKQKYRITFTGQADRPLQKHDLLQLHFQSKDQSPPTLPSDILTGFLPVSSISNSEEDNAITVEAENFICLSKSRKKYPPSHIRLLDRSEKSERKLEDLEWVTVEETQEDLSPPESRPLRLKYKANRNLASPQKGEILPVKWSILTSPSEEQFGFIEIQNVAEKVKDGIREVTIDVREDKIWELIDVENIHSHPYVERVSFAVIGGHHDWGMTSIYDLGFLGCHPRSWLDLTADNKFYRAPDEAETKKKEINDLNKEVRQKNLPFAAPDIEDTYFWFPLSMSESLINNDSTHAAGDTDPESTIIRDGLNLEGSLDKILLDKRLADKPSSTLEAEAINFRYIQHQKKEKDNLLKGIHSLFFVDEVTLFAVPDAIHRKWDKDSSTTKKITTPHLAPPTLNEVSVVTDVNVLHLSWQFNGAKKVEFILQRASDPQFLDIIQEYNLKGMQVEILYNDTCEQYHYSRVRAVSETQKSPWSNTEHNKIQSCFMGCENLVLNAPSVTLQKEQGVRFNFLIWEKIGELVEYEVQKSFDPLFGFFDEISAGSNEQYEITPHHIKTRYYRVRGIRYDSETTTPQTENTNKVFSPWSNSIALLPVQKSEWQLGPAESYTNDNLLKIHQAMLRMAQARGDLVAVLSLPEHYQSRQAIEYKKQVVSKVKQGAAKSLSYGAVYHPWLMSYQQESNLMSTPPDGVACGIIAQRSIQRGPWVAPANIVLTNIIALTDTYNHAALTGLYDNQLNVITTDSRGFIVFNANTLSQDESLKLLNVRRLMILLHRLALREGMETTFDPNNEGTRRLIERIFERTLTELYMRGAFSGDTPENAFRVIVNESNNSRQSVEQGRLVIDLKVAPSQPLTFLTVRLIHGDGETNRVVEI